MKTTYLLTIQKMTIFYKFRFILKNKNKLAYYLIIFFCLFCYGCNYNYYLGKQLEAKENYEEASIEYSRAYFNNPSNSKYKAAYERNAKKSITIFRERYLAQIKKKNYYSAYKTLEKSVFLVPDNDFFSKEQQNWQKLILVGSVIISTGKDIGNLVEGSKIYPVIRFNRINSENYLEATISPTGFFVVEDLLYKPNKEKYLNYTINSISIKLLPFSSSKQAVILRDSFIYRNLIEFKKPVLREVKGDFSKLANGLKQRDQVEKASSKKDFWYPSQDFFYATEIKGSKIVIKTTEQRDEFLPWLFYFSKQRAILDFGELKIQKKPRSFLWGISRNKQNSDYFAELNQNYYYSLYINSTKLSFYTTVDSL